MRERHRKEKTLKTKPGKTLLLLVLSLLAAACASQHGGSASIATTNANGCEIDAKKICEANKDLRLAAVTGSEDDPSQREQNSSRTPTWVNHFETPDKTTIEVSCEINIEHHKVIYAHALPGPTLTANDVDYLHNQGLCLNSQ